MSYWDTQDGMDTGKAIQDLVFLVNELTETINSKKIVKYDTPMKVKTFILQNEFDEALVQQDDKINNFIKDKHVIDIRMTRTNEFTIRVLIMYKDIIPTHTDDQE